MNYLKELDKVKNNSFELYDKLKDILRKIEYKYFNMRVEIIDSLYDDSTFDFKISTQILKSDKLDEIDKKYNNDVKKILDKYLDFLNEQDLFEFFFTCGSTDIYYLIVNKYENIIRKSFIKYSDIDIENMLLDSKHIHIPYPTPADMAPDEKFKNDIFFIFRLPIERVATDFYLRFGDVINFKDKNNILSIIKYIDYNYYNFEELFYKNQKYEKYISQTIVNRYCGYYHNFKNQEIMAKIFSHIELNNKNRIFFAHNYQKFYLDCEIDNIDNIKIDKNTNILSQDYMKVIKFLRKIKPKERRNYENYYNAYLLFFNYLNQKITDLNEASNIIEKVFQRVINRGFLVDVLSISSLKSFYLFYKYNAIIDDAYLKKYSIDIIKNFNFKKILPYLKDERFSLDILKKEIIVDNIETQTYYNYDFYDFELSNIINNIFNIYILDDKLNNMNVLNIIISKNLSLKYLVKLISSKDENYLKKFKNLIIQGQDDENLEKIVSYFDYYYQLFNQLFSYDKIKKRIASLDYVLIPSNKKIKNNLLQLDNIAKGDPQLEKMYGIKLYQEYKNRIYSSIPDVSGNYEGLNYMTVDMHDTNIISNGIGSYILPNNVYASSCLTPNGKASSCLFHGAVNPNGRFFKIEFNGKIIAYSWLWRAGEVLCFDNIELTKDSEIISDIDSKIFNILSNVADIFIRLTNKEIKLVILGRNKIDVKNKYFDDLEKSKTIYKPNQDDLYLKDSSECQLIIKGIKFTNLNISDVKPKFLYQRKKVQKFSEYKTDKLLEKINAIYYDYCIEHNLKYQKIYSIPSDGYIAEDWYYYKDSQEHFIYCGNDDRLHLEADRFTKLKHPILLKNNNFDYSDLLNISNYEIKDNTLKDYLINLKDNLFEFNDNDYLHNPHSFNTLTKILIDRYITSSNYGKRNFYGSRNGKYFISVAKNNTDAWNSYYNIYALIFNDINPQPIIENNYPAGFENLDILTDTSYPMRFSGAAGEYQIYEKISVELTKALIISNDINELVILTNLLETLNLDIALYKETKQYVDKNEVKKLFKYKVK